MQFVVMIDLLGFLESLLKNGSGLSITDFYDALSNNKSNKHLTVRDAIGGLPPIFPLKKIEKVKGRNVGSLVKPRV